MPDSDAAATAPIELTDADDKKLVVLARATRVRAGAREGVAMRDTDGRTYAAATVDLEALRISALGAALAMAVASGCRGLEAVVLLGADTVAEADLAAIREFAGSGVPIHVGSGAGKITGSLHS